MGGRRSAAGRTRSPTSPQPSRGSAAEHRAERTYVWLKPYLDRYLPNDPFQTIALIAAALLLGTVLKDLFAIVNNVLAARLAQLAAFDLRKRFYRRTLRLDLATFNDEGTWDLMSRFTNDMQNVAAGVESLFGKLVCEPLKMVACLVGAAWICWRLLLLVAGDRPAGRAGHSLAGQDAQAGQPPGDGGNGPDLQHPGRDLPRHQDRQGLHQRAAGAEAVPCPQQGVLQEGDEDRPLRRLSHPLTESHGHPHALPGAAGRGVAGAEGQTHAAGHPHVRRPMDREWLLVFYAFWPAWPIRCESSPSLQPAASAMAASDRIYQRLDREPAVRNPPAGRPVHRHHRDLVFDRVGFAYQPGQPVLDDVYLRIPFGETIAIVGAQRLRQEHAGQPGAAFRRSHRRRDPPGRRAAWPACGCATCAARSAW